MNKISLKDESSKDHLIELFIKDPLYKIDEEGRIYTKLTTNGQGVSKDWREMGYKKSDGYVRVRYKDDFLFVQRIIFRKFNGPLKPGHTIDHLDRDNSNNHPKNLVQKTQGENNKNKSKKYKKKKSSVLELVMAKLKTKELTEEEMEERHPSNKTVKLEEILKSGKLSILEKVKIKLAAKNQVAPNLVKQVSDRLNDYLSIGPNRPRISFGDVSVSVQAGPSLYSEPNSRPGPWESVELGFPSKRPPSYIMKYMEPLDKDPTKNVYGYVPIELVARWVIEEYGNDKLLDKIWLKR